MILVTGATGFIGNHLCQFLKKKGHRVIGVARNKKKHFCDELIISDIKDIKNLDGIDTVYHLAGVAHTKKEQKAYVDNNNSTIHFFHNCKKHKVKNFILISSVKAVKDSSDKITENHDIASNSPYGKAKYELEKKLLEESNNMHFCIIRPSLVYGKNAKGNLSKLNFLAKMKVKLPNILNKKSMVSVNDLCEAIYLAANHKKANKETFIITDKLSYSFSEIYSHICKKNKGFPFIYIPMFLLKIAAQLGDSIKKVYPKFFFDSEVLYKMINTEEYSSDKITQVLNWHPKENFFQS